MKLKLARPTKMVLSIGVSLIAFILGFGSFTDIPLQTISGWTNAFLLFILSGFVFTETLLESKLNGKYFRKPFTWVELCIAIIGVISGFIVLGYIQLKPSLLGIVGMEFIILGLVVLVEMFRE